MHIQWSPDSERDSFWVSLYCCRIQRNQTNSLYWRGNELERLGRLYKAMLPFLLLPAWGHHSSMIPVKDLAQVLHWMHSLTPVWTHLHGRKNVFPISWGITVTAAVISCRLQIEYSFHSKVRCWQALVVLFYFFSGIKRSFKGIISL